MLKVMHVLNTGLYSGAENVVITIINTTKPDVDSTYVSLDGDIKNFLFENNIAYYPVKKLGVFEIHKAINTIKPDIIHAHDFTAGIVCCLSETRIPIINHIHNNPPWIKKYNIRSVTYALSCCKYKKIITVSEAVMDEYIFGKRFIDKTIVVGNPVNVQGIRLKAGNDKKKLYDIAFLGRLSKQKNPYLFIDIIKILTNTNPDISVVMIGDGELRNEVEDRIINGHLQDNIKLVGFQKNPYEILKQSRILCMPSEWEGFGLAAVEGLSLGLPVVCSGVGGLKEIVNKKCGVICDNVENYAAAILELLNDKNKYKLMSINAVNRSDEMDNIKEYCEMIVQIYKSIMG